MSRSGYSDDCDEMWRFNLYRGRVTSAIRGKRGQKLLIELAQALDEMPVKELIADELETENGAFCTLGVLGKKRGLNMKTLDPEDAEIVGAEFNIAESLAREIVYLNDEGGPEKETPAQRWQRMRKWVGEEIIRQGVTP